MKKKMLNMTVLAAMTATLLLIQATGWAMEKAPMRPLTPQHRLNQLFASERVIDSNPAMPGVHGNSVPNLKRWNAILFLESVAQLRRQGPGTSPNGEIVSYDRQKVEPTGRIR